MNREQYESILAIKAAEPMIRAAELYQPHRDRVLLYGYSVERDTIALTLQNQTFFWKKFQYLGLGVHDLVEFQNLGSVLYDPEQWVPSKRTYPEACDAEFCTKLRLLDISPNFTRFNENVDSALEENRWNMAMRMA